MTVQRTCSSCGEQYSVENNGFQASICQKCRRHAESNASLKKLDESISATNQSLAEHTAASKKSSQDQAKAMRDIAAAARETTQAVQEQTTVIRDGFNETIGELRATRRELEWHGRVLVSIDRTLRSAVDSLHDLRDGLYATTKNREVLEAQSKLERAEKLLESEIFPEALRLISGAIELNPADFSVWFLKASVCARALAASVPFIPRDEALADGIKALDRAIRLAPKKDLSPGTYVAVGSSLITLSILFEDNSSFERSIEWTKLLIASSGPDPVVCESVVQLSRALDAAGRREDSSGLLRYVESTLVASVDSNGATQRSDVETVWRQLEEERSGEMFRISKSLQEAIKRDLNVLDAEITQFVGFRAPQSWSEKVPWWKDRVYAGGWDLAAVSDGVTDHELKARWAVFERKAAEIKGDLQDLVLRFRGIASPYGALDSAMRNADEVARGLELERWRSVVSTQVEKYHLFDAVAVLIFGLFSCCLFPLAVFSVRRRIRNNSKLQHERFLEISNAMLLVQRRLRTSD